MLRKVVLLTALSLLGSAGSAGAADRYAFAGGCYSATDASGKVVADTVRMQATELGRYLLYTKDGRFLTAGDGGLAPAPEPGPAADFTVDAAGGEAFTLAPQSTGQPILTVTFAPANGCAEFPEAPLNAEGTPRKAATVYERVGGLVEGHMHWMASIAFGGTFRCGRPWHPYGIALALPDCEEHRGPAGAGAPLQNAFTYGNPAQPRSTANYPTFPNQSKDDLTYEGMYWRWIQRVWKGGLRLMVMSQNENRVLPS